MFSNSKDIETLCNLDDFMKEFDTAKSDSFKLDILFLLYLIFK